MSTVAWGADFLVLAACSASVVLPIRLAKYALLVDYPWSLASAYMVCWCSDIVRRAGADRTGAIADARDVLPASDNGCPGPA